MLALAASAPRAAFLDESLARLPPSAATGYGYAAGDVDGDGSTDLFQAAGRASRLLLNDGAGNFTDASAGNLPAIAGRYTDARLVDVDGDGDLDLLLADADGAHALWRNEGPGPGAGTFSDVSAGQMPAPGGLGMGLAVADVDGDGDPDVVIALQDGPDRLLVNDGAGSFSDQSAGRLPPQNSPSTAAAFADVDGDGAPDLLITGLAGPALYLNDGLGNFAAAPAALPADLPAATGAAFVDVDGDGLPDLLLAAGAAGVLVLRNDPAGTFTDETAARMPAADGFAIKVAAADLTEDGAADLLAGFADGPRLLVSDGAGVFSDASASMLPADPDLRRAFGVAALDVDHDLDPDLLVASGAGGDRLLVNDIAVPRVRIAVSPTYVETGDPVTIQVDAFDEDGIALLEARVEDPLAGVTPVVLDPDGAGTFTPTQPGLHQVVVTATDSTAVTTTRRLGFVVVAPDLTPPTVGVTALPADPLVGQQVTITMTAGDANGIASRAVTVGGAPVPVTTGGVAHFTPSLAQVGAVLTVEARATDPRGNEGAASTMVTVHPDVEPPTVTLDVTPGDPMLLDPVSIQVGASDNVAVVSLQAFVTPPSGTPVALALDGAGSATFVPTEPGLHQVNVLALDPSNLAGGQAASFTAVGVPDVTPPQVSLAIVPASVATGQSATISVSATDDVGVTALELTVNGQPLPLAVDDTAVFTPPVAGSYTVRARAADAFGNEATAQGTLQAVNPADDTDPPVVAISSPAAGAQVGGIVPIVGTAADATFAGYELAVAPLGSGAFTTFATGTLPVAGAELGQLDTATLAEGYYQVRLTASDVNGTSASTTVNVLFVDNLRLGRFTLDYQDVRLEAFGLPLALQRSYDSASGTVGDFGLGWKLRLLDVEVRTDSAANVFITLPDGRRTAFAFTPQGVPFFPVFTTRYSAPAGVHATLTAPECPSLIRSGSQFFCNLTDPFPPSVYQLTLKDGTSYTIEDGEVTRIEDRNGNFVTLGPAGIIASSGRSIVFQRDGAGRITRATDPNGGEFLYTYDSLGRLQQTEDPEGHPTRYVYDGSSNRIVEVQTADTVAGLGTPGACSAIRNEYYPDGRISAREDAAGNRTTYAYDDVARSETVTDPLGNPTTYFYDGQGRVLQVNDAVGTTTLYTYDTAGNELSVTQPSGRVTTYTYDASGNRTSETHTPEPGVSLTSTSAYNAFGQLTRFTAPQGDRTEYVYDADGNQIRRERYDRFGALLETDTFTYDANGNRDSWTNPRGQVTTYENAPTGERIRETDQAGVSTQFEYDANGNRTAIIDGEGNRAEFEYNGLNRATLMRQGGVVRWQAEYDANGNLTSLTDAQGNVTTYGYDCSGNLVSVTGEESQNASYQYDGATNLTRVTDPRGQVTTYDYDPALRPTGRTGPDLQTWAYGFDPDGNIDEYLSPEAAAAMAPILHTYDGMQRLITRSEPERDIEYAIDANNRLMQVSEDDGTTVATTQFAYDELGNLLLVDAPAGSVAYTYDAGGQRATMTTPDGIVTHYSYDDGGRLQSMTTVDGVLASDSVTFTYDGAGRRVRADYSNGAFTTYGYDGLGRLNDVTIHDGGGAVIGRFDYAQDGNGNRTGVTLMDGSASYAYDGLYRLVSEDIDTASTGVLSRSYSYDAAGNRLDAGAVHGPDNRLLSDATGAYAYDMNGNVTGHGSATYAYDSSNRLVSFTQGATSASYAYDYLGRRVLRDVGGAVTEYVYDGHNVAAELVGAVVSKRYTHGAGPDEIHMVRVGGQSFFYHTDGVGSVVAITDATGNLVKRYAYDAWGNTLVDDGALPFDNTLRFAGRELDPESGLYHLRARAYAPTLGRFLQKDPQQGNLYLPQTLNLYAYALNNPVTITDPTGQVIAVEYAFILTFPNGREAAAALIGFLHGFGLTNIAFIGEFLGVVGNSNGLDLAAQWDLAIERTEARMEQAKAALDWANSAAGQAGVAMIPNAFKSGAGFQVGFEINISASLGPFSASTGDGVSFERSAGGFDNGVAQGLSYLRQLRPR